MTVRTSSQAIDLPATMNACDSCNVPCVKVAIPMADFAKVA
ncbi:MAG: hypothetical protein ACKVVT_19225 [Dehalococcoidia bacterium]